MERGAYTADRAAALSGVPKSTVHYWAREGLVVPSVSPQRIKLWSYTDLMGLRAVYWLRHPKPGPDGEPIPQTPMPRVREALAYLETIDLGIWDAESNRYMVRVDRSGEIHVGTASESVPMNPQTQMDVVDLIQPFESEEDMRGPDLVKPRPLLRIIPGKLAGAPHLARTRLETEALAALSRQGVANDHIYELYPGFDTAAIDEALELEVQLEANLHPMDAAA